MIANIDLNKRTDFIIQSFGAINPHKIVTFALPFLSLNRTASIGASIGLGIYECSVHPSAPRGHWVQIALTVSSAALSIFCPTGQLLLSNTLFVLAHTNHFIDHLKQRKWQECGIICLKIMHQAVYLASIYYGTPAWIVLSLLSQACTEIHQALKQKQAFEMAPLLLLASMRLWKAYSYLPSPSMPPPLTPQSASPEPLVSPLRQNNCSATFLETNSEPSAPKPLTQSDWTTLNSMYPQFNTTSAPKPIDLYALLTQHGFSTLIEGIDFTKERALLMDALFRNLQFKDCTFLGVDFSLSRFNHVQMEGCNLQFAIWNRASFCNCTFTGCDFSASSFFNSFFENVSFIKCPFSQAFFYDPIFKQITIELEEEIERKIERVYEINLSLLSPAPKDVDLFYSGLTLQSDNVLKAKSLAKKMTEKSLLEHFWIPSKNYITYTSLLRNTLQLSGAIVL